VPFVLNAAHQQRAVKLGRAGGKALRVIKETGLDLFDLERLNLPVAAAKFEPVVLARMVRIGLAERPAFEKLRDFRDRRKD